MRFESIRSVGPILTNSTTKKGTSIYFWSNLDQFGSEFGIQLGQHVASVAITPPPFEIIKARHKGGGAHKQS